MQARRNGLALLCAVALMSGAAVATTSSPVWAQPAQPKGQPKGQPAQPKGQPAQPAQPKGQPAQPKGQPKETPKEAPAANTDEAKKEEAKKLYGEANDKFKANDFAGALPLFQAADKAYPGAAPKHKIALCLDKLGRSREAIGAYRAFIESQPGDKYQDKMNESAARIGALEATLPAQVTVKLSPAEAKNPQLTVDGRAVAGMQFEIPGGAHSVVITAEGYQTVTEQVNVKGAEQRDLLVMLSPAVAAPPPQPPINDQQPVEEEGGGGSNVPAYVTLGIAGAGVILGVVFGVQALGAKGDFEDDPTTDNADAAERDALIADMSFGVALTFGITGIVLLFTGGGEEEAAPAEGAPAEKTARPFFSPYAGPTGGGMAATWKF